jgi:hypothetical protein
VLALPFFGNVIQGKKLSVVLLTPLEVKADVAWQRDFGGNDA